MSRILKFLTGRFTIVAVLITAQLLLVAASVNFFSEYLAVYFGLNTVIALAVVCRIVAKRDNPAYKMAWIILVLLIPPFGAAVYFIFSGNQLTERTKRKLSGMYDVMKLYPVCGTEPPKVIFDSDSSRRQSDYILSTTACPPYVNSGCTYYSSGEEMFPALLEKLRGAEKFIFLEYFIIAKGVMWDAIHEILVKKASEGVDVRVIYDDMGCISKLESGYNRVLEREGIGCRVFNRFIPILSARLNNRNHRKICVIDGRCAFTGGLNLSDEYINETHPFGYWKDNAVMLEGKAVYSMTLMFLSMWDSLSYQGKHGRTDVSEYFPLFEERLNDGVVQPYTDNPLDDEAVGETVYLNMIYSATKYIWITTPYLIIDYNMEQALCNAAKSGIDVRIIVPGIPDKKIIYEATRSNYKALIDSGVRIYEYTPGFIHSKTFLCDDKYGTVGSVNLDYRSLYLHFECGVWLWGASALKDIKRDLEDIFKVSREVTKESCKANIFKRAMRSVLEVMAPLF